MPVRFREHSSSITRDIPEKPVTSVYITGRGAKIPKFFEKLEETLVEEVNYLEAINGIEDKYIPAHTLCMHLEVLPNLLPEGAKRKEQERTYKRYISIGTFALAGILFLLSLGMWSTLRECRYENKHRTEDPRSH